MTYQDDFDSVSVLVATRNRPDALRACIDSLLLSNYPRFEIIVVDQSAKPLVLDDPRVRVVSSDRQGKSCALNVALSFATGNVFAFTDDDCTVPPDWLAKGMQLLRSRPQVGFIFAALMPAPHDPIVDMIPSFLPSVFETQERVEMAQVRAGAGANMFIRRSVFDAIRGFDELLGPGAPFKSCEEFDLYYRTLAAGFAVARDPENPVTHWGARSIIDGSAEKLIRDYWFGEAAVLAKRLKSGDWHALTLSGRIFADEAKFAMLGALRLRTGNARRAWSWLRGFTSGLTTSLDGSGAFFKAGKPPQPSSVHQNELVRS